jgi:hypothetical protein
LDGAVSAMEEEEEEEGAEKLNPSRSQVKSWEPPPNVKWVKWMGLQLRSSYT